MADAAAEMENPEAAGAIEAKYASAATLHKLETLDIAAGSVEYCVVTQVLILSYEDIKPVTLLLMV